MTKNEISVLIKTSPKLNDFINAPKGYIDFKVSNVPVYIFKEDIGVNYYYKFPYNEHFNYKDVVSFMKYAIPILSKILEEKRKQDRRVEPAT